MIIGSKDQKKVGRFSGICDAFRKHTKVRAYYAPVRPIQNKRRWENHGLSIDNTILVLNLFYTGTVSLLSLKTNQEIRQSREMVYLWICSKIWMEVLNNSKSHDIFVCNFYNSFFFRILGPYIYLFFYFSNHSLEKMSFFTQRPELISYNWCCCSVGCSCSHVHFVLNVLVCFFFNSFTLLFY
jgi:hypothetical protein